MVKETTRENVKKKRKSAANTDDSETQDVYKKVVEFEEKEALRRTGDVDSSLYINITDTVRQQLAKIFELKKANDFNCNQTNAKGQLSELWMDTCVNISVLKKLNRMEKVRTIVNKEQLLVAKQKLDSINLQNQNLLYEAHHLLCESNKCFQFKSKDQDIELISLENFMRDAPLEITKKFENITDEDTVAHHELRLARLEWELSQRKHLAELCTTLLGQNKKVNEHIIQLRSSLDGLGPRLAAVLEATKPLQEQFDLPIDKIKNEHRLASLLPNPMYLFYVNIEGYKQAFDVRMNIAIVGDAEEAALWKDENNAGPNVQDEEDTDTENTPEAEEIAEVKKRRHRKSVQVDPLEQKKKKLLEVHPFSVEVTLSLKSGVSITLKLSYYTQLKIITTTSTVCVPDSITGHTAREILSGESILSELTPGDDGLVSPNPSNVYQLKKLNLGTFESLMPRIGYAYRWTQKVCGFDFLGKMVSKEEMNRLSQTSVETVMRSLSKRLQARFALAQQLQKLEQNIIPDLPVVIDVPKNHISGLTKWSSSTYQQFCQAQSSNSLIEGEFVTSNDTFYSATISRNNANLHAFIVIKNDYPITPPIFSLSLTYNGTFHPGNSDEIRDMERAVNIGWSAGASSASWLLSAQVTHLCSFLDVYLETQDPQTFTQNTMFFKNVCGRNRRRPLKFKKFGTGVFIQY